MVKALRRVPDERIRAYIVWLPIFGGDFQGEAQKLSDSFRDARVSYFIDPESDTGKEWQRILKTPFLAWDVYLLYGPDADWEAQPEQPAFWMQQLGLVNNAPSLDGDAFTAKLKGMVDVLKSKSDKRPASSGTVEFLYFKSCPGHKQALVNLKAALKESGIKARIVMVNVTSEAQAARVRFQGSPSIRINGKDIEGRGEGHAYSCRIYLIDGKATATPTKEFIAERLRPLFAY